MAVLVFWLVGLLATSFLVFTSFAGEDISWEELEGILSDSELKEYIEDLDRQLEKGNGKSVEQMCLELYNNKDYSFSDFFRELAGNISIDFKEYKELIIDLLMIGFSAAMFSSVSMAFSKKGVSEYGFYAAYVLLFGVVLSAFINASAIAVTLIKNIMSFVKVVVPAFAMALACSGKMGYAAGVGQLMLILCGVAGLFFVNLLVKIIRIYLVLGLSNSMLGTDKFSHLSDMIGKGVAWLMRSVFVFFCGIGILQKMFWPAFDSIKNTVAIKTMSVIPVVGTTMNAAGQTVLGAFMVLKASIGTLAILFVITISAVPVLKLLMYYVSFNLAAVVIQPVCDKRFCESLKIAAKASGLLSCLMLVVGGMFIIILAIATG